VSSQHRPADRQVHSVVQGREGRGGIEEEDSIPKLELVAMQSPRNRLAFRHVLRDMVYAAIEQPSRTPTD
jgi:hypothetical protein